MLFYFFILIFGFIVGSFLNVVIIRLNNGGKIVRGRSQCVSCHHVLSGYDLIPVISFLVQRGRCRYCRKKISWQYPLVEAATALLFLFSAYNIFGGTNVWTLVGFPHLWLLMIRNFLFISFCIVIFVYDLRWYLILDRVTLPAMVVALICNLLLGFSWWSLPLGAVIGFGFFGIQYVVSSGKWIGGGDLRLGALMGLMLGWSGLLVALFFSYIIGAVLSSALVLGGRKKFKSQVPFATFLTVGTLIALFWGEAMINWYLKLF